MWEVPGSNHIVVAFFVHLITFFWKKYTIKYQFQSNVRVVLTLYPFQLFFFSKIVRNSGRQNTLLILSIFSWICCNRPQGCVCMVCVWVRVSACECVCVRASVNVLVPLYVCMCMCTMMCMCMCIYVCLSVCVSSLQPKWMDRFWSNFPQIIYFTFA